MTIELQPSILDAIHRRVASGRYHDADEVVSEALRLLDERDQHERLKAAVAVGIEDARRGDVVRWTPDFMERLQREADEEDRLGLPIEDDDAAT